ncbi:hypothetical protein BDP55DRAFT_629529 [Colletotrichum godetiae]|uniref:Fungal N-terminal domain-containing protein n=1 Tax=Colletotrichum godetiae TaxID=1209918 RepID=A0AAJ0F0F5_9PEZI|nr:uncharacterized protein BDP55DRAFT_629529 [Colletotrichum godetiae]KAK1688422.1 hypothetical protein BDP55DRAFT_629529 [Colletotrichum godetiae]
MEAESLGLAASVAGLLSLGLQITGGIVKYMDAFEGRDEELRNVKKQNDNLAVALRAMKTALAGLQDQSPDIIIAVEQNIRSCEEDLGAVEALCVELSDRAGSTWTRRLENKKKKLTFAFHRPELRDLAQQLQQAHGALQTLQGTLGLENSNRNTTRLMAIESNICEQVSDMLLVRSEVAALATPVANINEKLPGLQSSVDRTVQLFADHSGAMTTEFLESRHELRLSHNTIVEELQMIRRDFGRLQLLEEENKSLRVLALRTASKPAMLKSLCDDMKLLGRDWNQGIASDPSKVHWKGTPAESSRNSRTVLQVDRLCICPRPERSARQVQMQRGYTTLSGEWESRGHWSSCPLSKMPRKQRLKASLKYTGISRLLKSVIDVSFALTSGAGGYSISPSFTYCPTVDRKSDPAFRIIDLIRESIHPSKQHRPSREAFATACLKKLARLLEEKQTCPTAVDDQNMTRVHHAASSIRIVFYRWRAWLPEIRALSEIFPMLLSYGASAYAYDTKAVEVLSRANLDSQPALLNGVSSDIFNDGNEIDESIPSYDKFPEAATGTISFKQASECGPLGMAVIRSDFDEVGRVLSRFPDSIAELDIYGRSPLHLAAAKPEILEALVKYADANILNQRDKAGATALEMAMIMSSDHCVNGLNYEKCKRCSCYICVKHLIDAGCDIRTCGMRDVAGNVPSLTILLGKASERARRCYVLRMEQARNPGTPGRTLPNKGICTKQNTEETRSKSNNSTGRGQNVQESPAQAPRILRVCVKADQATSWVWIFDEIQTIHVAELFRRHGFMPDPSIFDPRRRNYQAPFYLEAHFICWLVDHGGDLFLRSPVGPINRTADDGIFAAHFVFYLLGAQSCMWSGSWRTGWRAAKSDAFEKVVTTVTSRNLTDGCCCPCSARGCVPFTWMMKGFVKFSSIPDEDFPYNYVDEMVAFYSSCGLEMTLLSYAEAIRFMTFEALGLVHSCCDAHSLTHLKSDWIDIDHTEIIEDQHLLVELLEELVVEFVQKAAEYLGDGPDNRPLFPQFWVSYWIDRMLDELEELGGNELTEAERRGAEELGVEWRGPIESGNENENPYNEYDLEHYFYELDLICPEYNEPWPEGTHPTH